MKKTILLSIACIALSSQSNAQTATPAITKRQVNQHQRIQQGVQSGQLTRSEARHLKMRESKIRHDKKLAKVDGVVTPAEKAKLDLEQNRAARQ